MYSVETKSITNEVMVSIIFRFGIEKPSMFPALNRERGCRPTETHAHRFALDSDPMDEHGIAS